MINVINNVNVKRKIDVKTEFFETQFNSCCSCGGGLCVFI
jgi:hypothetical protein